MSASGTGGVGIGMENLLPEMDDDDMGMDDMDLGGDEGLDDMGDEGLDDLGGEGLDDGLGDEGLDDLGGEEMSQSVDLDTLRGILDECCPEQSEMILARVEESLGDAGLGDEGLGDEGLGDEMGGLDDLVGDEGGLDDEGLGDEDYGDVDGMEECYGGRGMAESFNVSDIANMITEDPDVFVSRRRKGRNRK